MADLVLERYKYIYPPSYPHSPADVMETKYKTRASLVSRFIAYAHGSGYYIFDNLGEFYRWMNHLPIAERVFHEVIFDKPQKLKFDIDAAIDKLTAFQAPTQSETVDETFGSGEFVSPIATKYKQIFDAIVDAIRDAFLILYET